MLKVLINGNQEIYLNNYKDVKNILKIINWKSCKIFEKVNNKYILTYFL